MSRTLTMTFADFQMVQVNSKQITVGAGYKIKGLKLPFKLPNGKKIRLDNDLTFRFDFSYRDDITVNNQIDQGPAEITAGATTITIQPSVDYIISKRLTVRLFYDESKTIPKISSTYPTTNIKSGITFRFSLAE
jgi:cell surface protein SprA